MLFADLHQEEDWYVARCREPDVTSQGATREEALANLREAVQLYLDEVTRPTGETTARHRL